MTFQAQSTNHLLGVRRFQQALDELHENIRRDNSLTAREQEEGYAYLAGMAHLALGRAFVSADMDYPRFVSCINPFSRWGLENVDNLYLCADVRPGVDYLVKGNVGDCADVVYETLTKMVGDDGSSLGEGIGSIDLDTLQVEPSGDYSLLVAAERGEAVNYLQAGPDVGTVFLRKTVNDWGAGDTGWQTIEAIGDVPAPNRFDAPGDTDLLWSRAAELLSNQVNFLDAFSKTWPSTFQANTVSVPTSKASGYLPGQFNSAGVFDLGADECLLITTDAVECRHMSLAAGHYQWFNSFDGGVTPSQLNRDQSHLGSDGRYHYVVAAKDPGVPNWIDTSRHTRGFLFLRWQGVRGHAPLAPSVEVVDLADVRSSLPDDTPVVTAQERLIRVRGRRLALDRRYAI